VPPRDCGEIRGRVLDAAGHGLADCTVMLGGDAPPHPDVAALSGETGEFSFLDLTPGRYEVIVRCGEAEPERRQVEVSAGGIVRVEIRSR
jgi:hypothetical protein